MAAKMEDFMQKYVHLNNAGYNEAVVTGWGLRAALPKPTRVGEGDGRKPKELPR